MFGVGVGEFLFILVLALIILGPERLPIAMRTLGRWVRRLRETTREFRQEFAEEFSMLYEEMDVLRQEAETTRRELAEIRADLTETMQEAADDVNQAGRGVMQDMREAVNAADAQRSAGSAGGARAASAGGARAASALPAPAVSANGAAPGEPLPAPDAMALAIRDTFATEAVPAAAAPASAPAASPPPRPAAAPAAAPGGEPGAARRAPGGAPQPGALTAYAPDVDGPVDPEEPAETAPAAGSPAAAPLPPPAPAAQAADLATTPDEPAAQVPDAVGPPTPSLQNQMGGFVRLMAMQAVAADPGFAAQAETTLRAQAQADAASLETLQDAEPRAVADAWAHRRRHLVPHESVDVDQHADESAVVELGVCPYGLTPGDDHPICNVSNAYDDEFFKHFAMKATYTSRMSDGAPRCQLVILTHARMRKFGLKIEDDTADRERGEAVVDAV